MKKTSYNTSFQVNASPTHVFNCINDVPKWFPGRGYEGSSHKLNDEFVFRYENEDHSHYSRQKLVEFIPGKKVVWFVSESHISWIPKNKEEWTGTKIIFELTSNGDKTILDFTHDGLTPELECYSEVQGGWDIIIKDWLFNYIQKGK